MPQQQGAQYHDTALLGEQLRRRDLPPGQDKLREPFKRKNMESRVTIESGGRGMNKQLPLELERGLFGRQQNQRQSFRGFPQGGADFGQAEVSFAAAGRTQEKACLHTGFFVQNLPVAKQFIQKKMASAGQWAVVFFISF